MTTYYYKKHNYNIVKNSLRVIAVGFIFIGIATLLYVLLPFISWHLYFSPVFAAEDLTIPIPKTTIVTNNLFGSLIETAANTTNYQDAKAWFPTYRPQETTTPRVGQYFLTIPKLGVTNAIVGTMDYDLDKHLVHYGGTALPPDTGNAVIFGHSTLPQLFNPTNYKTIFANAYTLQVSDTIIATVENVSYTYKIVSITVVDPSETSFFSQDQDNSYLTLVTCTPPGTTWKRLIIRGKLQSI